MHKSSIKLGEFKIIGISVRTSNSNGQSRQDIAELWDLFIQDHLTDKIPHKKNTNIYCVYTDYESDVNGEYTAIIGCSVDHLDDMPAGFVGKIIPETKYIHYKSVGQLPDAFIMT